MFVISTLVAFSGSADRVTTRTASSVRIAESDRLLEAGSFGNDLGASLEREAYSHESVDDVDLDGGIGANVRDGDGRADIGEDQVIYMPDRDGVFRREIGHAVGAL